MQRGHIDGIHPAPPTDEDHTALAVEASGDDVEAAWRRHDRRALDRVRQGPARTEQRLAEGEIQLHRPRAGVSHGVVGEFAPQRAFGVVGHTRVAEPHDVLAVEVDLVDGLRSADAT